MVARTFPFGPRDKPPLEPLPSLSQEEMDKQQSPAEQLRHVKDQIALAKAYPGRTPPRE